MKNEEIEMWKPIPRYEKYYYASNLGRIKSVPREKTSYRYCFVDGKILKGTVNPGGYLVVGLSVFGVTKIFTVHKLIAITFLNHKPDGTFRLVIDHIDNNKLNNRLNNLQLISNRENTSKDKKGYSSKHVGVHKTNKKKSWTAFIRIKDKKIYLGDFYTEEEASKAYKQALFNWETKQEVYESSRKKYKYKNITYNKIRRKWHACKMVNYKKINIGFFETEEEAYLAKLNYEKQTQKSTD